MSDINDSIVVTPKEGNSFYSVSVEIQEEDMDTGKIRKVKEEHLVDGVNCTEVENKVKEQMEGTMAEWKIKCIKESKISVVY
jgi:hypothetical protein